MATFRNTSFEQMVTRTLKQSAAVLNDAEIPFVLIGSLSAWVRGGPESSHDLDFGVRPEDLEAVIQAFTAAGYTIEFPPEDWLVKAWHGPIGGDESTLVDLIFAPSGMEINDEVLQRADEMDVLAARMKVLSATDLMVMKLMSLREQHLNYTSLISTARSIREQIDWQHLREACSASPYAEAFFVMADRLGISVSESPISVLSDMQHLSRPKSEGYEIRRRLHQRHRTANSAHSSA